MTRRAAGGAAAAAFALTLGLAACSGSGSADPTGETASPTETGPLPWETEGSSSSSSTTGSSRTSSSSRSGSSTKTFPSPTDTGDPFDREEFVGSIEQAAKDNPTAAIDVDVVIDGTVGASAKGVQDLDNDALDMEVDLGGQTLTYRYVDGQYYLAQPPKWVKVDPDSADPAVKTTLDQVQVLSMKRQLKGFLAGVTTVGDKGTEDVNGAECTHFTAQVDTAKALEAMGEPANKTAPKTLLYDVWLDEDDLIRKMSFTQGNVKASMLADRWGEPVDITAPPASQIAHQ